MTPFESGFRLPAEWEPHAATWIGWPHNESDWETPFDKIRAVYVEIVRGLVRGGENVHILVNSQAHEQEAVTLLALGGVDISPVTFFRWPTNRGWLRDFGAICVRHEETGEVAPIRFRFNAWARYDDYELDDAAGAKIVETIGGRAFIAKVNGRDVILEGGGIDSNGRGTLLTTEEWLLDPETQIRNPGFTRRDYETLFRDYLGVTNVLWLGTGIAGDDTHGHVDDICRFVNANTVVLAMEYDPSDENYRSTQENRERLSGQRIEVVELPLPSARIHEGERYPASYANFYIANSAVLVPTFNDPNDAKALGILGDLFPGRAIIPIRAEDLVLGNGTLHCLSHEQPS